MNGLLVDLSDRVGLDREDAVVGQRQVLRDGLVEVQQFGRHAQPARQAAQAVLDGKVAAAYVMRSQAENALAQTPSESRHWAMSELPLNGLPPNGWPLGMAIKSGASKDLGQALEKALQALRDSGELLAIFKRNGMTLTAP